MVVFYTLNGDNTAGFYRGGGSTPAPTPLAVGGDTGNTPLSDGSGTVFYPHVITYDDGTTSTSYILADGTPYIPVATPTELTQQSGQTVFDTAGTFNIQASLTGLPANAILTGITFRVEEIVDNAALPVINGDTGDIEQLSLGEVKSWSTDKVAGGIGSFKLVLANADKVVCEYSYFI